YESGDIGYDFVAEGRTILRERQAYTGDGMSYYLNDRTYQVMASDLASREDLSGRPETAYGTAGIGKRVAGFDLFEASYLGSVPAQLNATTGAVATDVVEIPQGFIDLGNDVVQNVDYRVGSVDLGVGEGANFQVGDVITFAGVNSLSVMDKKDTNELMTFRVVAKATDTLTIYPKPIAADQTGITTDQAAYANISTQIVATTVVSKVNVNGGRANSFWANDSISIVNGDAPLDMLNEFDGMKVVSETLDSGVRLYMAYDASLPTLNCRVRLFTWYGLVNRDPSRNGNGIYVPV
ncbi:MAG TPA: P22 phage major capsid protein family protein, partial [Candidatus Obscuribacterales bacterium]